MTKTAREVVAAYIKDKQDADKPKHERDVIDKRTREVVDELPDGFEAKDVRVCVAAVTEDDPSLDELTSQRRNRQVTKTLGEMVADGSIALNGKLYSHQPEPAAATGAAGLPIR
jgi:hypothetical protein